MEIFPVFRSVLSTRLFATRAIEIRIEIRMEEDGTKSWDTKLCLFLLTGSDLAGIKREGNDGEERTVVGARRCWRTIMQKMRKRVAWPATREEGGREAKCFPLAFRPAFAKSESDNGAARLMTRNAFSSQPV